MGEILRALKVNTDEIVLVKPSELRILDPQPRRQGDEVAGILHEILGSGPERALTWATVDRSTSRPRGIFASDDMPKDPHSPMLDRSHIVAC
jgi:hypothetical protein